MRILLANRFFGGDDAPTGRMLADLAKVLSGRGHTVEILTSAGAYARVRTDKKNIEKEFALHILWTANDRSRALAWLLYWLQAAYFIAILRWDRCVILTDPPFLIFAVLDLAVRYLLGQRRLSEKVIWWTMDLYPEALVADGMLRPKGLVNWVLRNLIEIGLCGIESIVCLGERQKERLETYKKFRQGTNYCHVIAPWDLRPLCPPLAGRNQVRSMFGWERKKTAIYAGNLGRGHTYRDILEAARELESQPDVQWVFAFFCRGAARSMLESESSGLSNVLISNYLPQDLSSDLLHAADVHLITMADGWDGIVVPSKLSGVLRTPAPVLFVGPIESDTASEIRRKNAGICLPNGCGSKKVIHALEVLSDPSSRRTPESFRDGPIKLADIIER